MPTINHLRDLTAFLVRLDAYGVPRSLAVEKALALDAHVSALHQPQPLPDNLLSLKPEEITRLWRQRVLTSDANLAGAATAAFQPKFFDLAKDALREHVPVILKALRPRFDAAAKAVTKAAEAGIRPNADAQSVIDLDNTAALSAWKTLRSNAEALSGIARLWVDLSETLDLPPHVTPAARMIGERPDWTVCFVDPKTNLTSGYHLEGNEQFRWLSLAIATGGRLRLNSPEEAERVLHGVGESPGWVICGAGVVVWDEDGRQLQLYTGAWIPSWVERSQLDNLIDSGMVVAAKPDAVRPPDTHPLGSDGNPMPKRSAFAR